MLGRMLCASLLIALAGCAGSAQEAGSVDTVEPSGEIVAAANDAVDPMLAGEPCPEVRPQICTLQYVPVCGRGDDGFHADYGNFCGACGDERVLRVIAGRCPDAAE